jgi:cell division septal protein FtsQ
MKEEKQIDIEILKRKKSSLRRERLISVFKQRLKFLVYVPFFLIFIFLFFCSPFFKIKEIEVNELSYIDEDEIVNDFTSLENENFFLTDLTDLRAEVIKKYAFIENIYTEKVFPDKVLVHIREKEPFLVVSNDLGCYLLDKLGFVLLESDCSSLKSNYSVKEVLGEGFNNIDFIVNTQSNFYNAEKIYEIVSVLDYYGYNVKKIKIENQVATFELHDDRFFVFSFADDIDMQLKKFIVVKKKIDYDNMSFETIDMRYNRPVLKGE